MQTSKSVQIDGQLATRMLQALVPLYKGYAILRRQMIVELSKPAAISGLIIGMSLGAKEYIRLVVRGLERPEGARLNPPAMACRLDGGSR